MFTETTKQIKDSLKDFITGETKPEDARKIADIDKHIDDLIKQHDEDVAAHNKLKDDYLNLIRSTGFKSAGDPADDDISRDDNVEKDIDYYLDEVVKKRDKK